MAIETGMNVTDAVTLLDQLSRMKQRAKELEAHIEKLETRPRPDELDSKVMPGDLIIRRVANGYIIRCLASLDVDRHQTWLVEGEMPEAIKQLTAIHATKVMEKGRQQKELFVDVLSPHVVRDFSGIYNTSSELYETTTGKKPFV